MTFVKLVFGTAFDITSGNNTKVSTVGTAPSKHSSILNVKITFPQTEDPKEAVHPQFEGRQNPTLKKPNAAISTQADVPTMRALFGTWAHFNNVRLIDLQPYRNVQQDWKRSISFTIIFGSTLQCTSRSVCLGLERSSWRREYPHWNQGLTSSRYRESNYAS